MIDLISSPPHSHLGRDAQILAFALTALNRGSNAALLTISGIEGGAPRPLGALMAVIDDGSYSGFVSGGCVEPAIAAEVLPLIQAQTDKVLRFGAGSPFFDVQFPCGGGVDLLVHSRADRGVLREALNYAGKRMEFTLQFDLPSGKATVSPDSKPIGWHNGMFCRPFEPHTKLVLVGRGPDFEATAIVGTAAEFFVHAVTPDAAAASRLSDMGIEVQLIASPQATCELPLDRYSAAVFMFHEHEWELPLLRQALAKGGFYIGALGSRNTHRNRCARLLAAGAPKRGVEQIRAPIGLIQHTKDPATLALSVLAEIAEARRNQPQ